MLPSGGGAGGGAGARSPRAGSSASSQHPQQQSRLCRNLSGLNRVLFKLVRAVPESDHLPAFSLSRATPLFFPITGTVRDATVRDDPAPVGVRVRVVVLSARRAVLLRFLLALHRSRLFCVVFVFAREMRSRIDNPME